MAEMVDARVTSTSQHYADGVERVTLDVLRRDAGDFPVPPAGEEHPVELVLESSRYGARLRQAGSYVYVCADLTDHEGEKVRLADVLSRHRIEVGEHVRLRVDGDRVHVVAGSVD